MKLEIISEIILEKKGCFKKNCFCCVRKT